MQGTCTYLTLERGGLRSDGSVGEDPRIRHFPNPQYPVPSPQFPVPSRQPAIPKRVPTARLPTLPVPDYERSPKRRRTLEFPHTRATLRRTVPKELAYCCNRPSFKGKQENKKSRHQGRIRAQGRTFAERGKQLFSPPSQSGPHSPFLLRLLYHLRQPSDYLSLAKLIQPTSLHTLLVR